MPLFVNLSTYSFAYVYRDRKGDAGLGLNLAETLSLSQQLSGTSTRANSEISLNSRGIRGDYGKTYTSSPNAKYKKIDRMDKVDKILSQNNRNNTRNNQTRV